MMNNKKGIGFLLPILKVALIIYLIGFTIFALLALNTLWAIKSYQRNNPSNVFNKDVNRALFYGTIFYPVGVFANPCLFGLSSSCDVRKFFVGGL
jgi:predicted membrane protein